MDDQDRRQLEQELRDERARRRESERRLEELTRRADLWRDRAEERTQRIERLLEAQKRPASRLRRWLKGLSTTDVPEKITDPTTKTRPPEPATRQSWPTMRTVVSVSAVGDEGKRRALRMFDDRLLPAAPDEDLDRADLVVVEPGELRTMGAAEAMRLRDWSQRSARQPMVIWAADGDLSPVEDLRAPGDVVVASDPQVAESLGVPFLPGCLNPEQHRPTSGISTVSTGRLETTLERPALETIEAAASGTAFSKAPGADVAARRWAYRHHAPWVRAAAILDLARVTAPDPIPPIGAVLVSHRPEALPKAIEAIVGQTHRRVELVVGIHGAEPTAEIEAALDKADGPAELLVFDSGSPLGHCLNTAAAHTSAPLLAKFDDDDHYGPAHLEDSFHALAYSGADIVGKGSHFTYVAALDRTVVRRADLEEAFIDGSPNGATLVFRRAMWDQAGFPHRPRHVDTGFLRGSRTLGAVVYAGSRWEFCYVRASGEGHTWDAEPEVFLAGADPAWDGFHPDRVEVADLQGI